MTSKEAYNYLLGLLESGGDMRWSLVKESMDKFKELVDQQDILDEYNITPENIREVLLTGQMFRNQPTFDECIKEWEERGFEFVLQKKGYVINGFLAGLKDKYISIRLKGKQYVWLSDETFLSYEEVHLLSKTLKALEGMKNENS